MYLIKKTAANVIFVVQRCKDRAKHIKASNNPDLTFILQSGDCILCNDLRKCNYFQEKSEKKRNFLPKSFADTEKSRTFAADKTNKGI